MLSNPCPACRFINRPTTRRCEVCGAALGDFDTVPQALTHVGEGADGADAQVGALWFDDLSPPKSPPRSPLRPPRDIPRETPRDTSRETPRDAPPAEPTALPGVTVREIRLGQPNLPAVRPLPAAVQPPAVSAATLTAPPASSPPAPLPAPLPVPLPAPPPATALLNDRAARAAIKVARRAAVRRARQAAAQPLQSVGDVLVMDAEAITRNQLDDLLGDFGFRVRPVATLAQAALLAGFHPFAAVFVAVPPGAVDGAVHDLFEQVRTTGRRAGVAPAVRVLVAAQWSPMDRVRAELAGCEATLARPVSRRDVARVLDANGVVLPRDPRRL